MKRQRFLQYSDAVLLVRRREIRSRTHYWKWYDIEMPPLPRHPEAHYAEWDSWNAFLGNTNSFEKMTKHRKGMKVSWRPFWEAVRYAQKIAKEKGITVRDQWEEWHDSGMCPKDIPKRPHHVYQEFTGKGWGVWLGTKIEGKIMSHKQNISLLAFHTTTYAPKNILTVLKHENGMASLREAMEDDNGLEQPLRLYKYEPELSGDIHAVLTHCASDRGNHTWLVANVHELFFELDHMLEWAVRPKR